MGVPPFQRFLDEHGPAVHGFLVASVGRVEADDCFQETFLSALRAYPKLRDASNLRAWLFQIAHRKALDVHRGRARRPIPLEELPEVTTVGGEGEREPELWRAVRRLPDKQRTAVRARFVDDLAYADIGRLLRCSEEAARRNVHEGIKKLRTTWT